MPFGTIKLNDGNEIPMIAFGTGSVNKYHDITDLIIQAIETGFSHIDTAQWYENEESVRNAIRQTGLARSEFFVTTKYVRGVISKTVRESLEKLGLEYVDLYLIHHPSKVNECDWTEFEKIKEEGLAKSIGVSNYNLEQLQYLVKTASIKPAVNQIELNPYNYAERKELLEYAAKHNIVIEAYSSLTPITTYPGGAVDLVVTAIAKRRGAVPSQIIFLWVRAKGAVIVTTSSKKSRLEEYLATADLPPLTEDEIAEIDAAGAKGPPIWLPIDYRPAIVSLALYVLWVFHLYHCAYYDQ